ncbi:HlyD family efflux transporter periplasmic adaptor subunit [Microaerobacter geothermalis]|uniref:HlyD family secretion protein n=1 Tax=Microaerobacter geothermalis TaxID=674972 RepID=UPI001F46E0F4|nr:HlyD family efflux transporter periplasmic adaptor subunit [Microaerobacter geothermalis]MCF6093438.1 HlyD family efflux transporter periplasmic adaptor subunit [Microaerobacter geothermalis]
MNWKKKVMGITGLVVIVLVGYGVFQWFTVSKETPGIISAYGTVEGEEVMVSSETSGQVIDVNIKEGDLVKKGDPLITVDDEALKIKLEQAKVQVKMAEVQMKQALGQVEAMKWQVKQADLGSSYAETEVAQRQREAEKALAVAQSGLKQAEAQYNQVKADMERYKELYSQRAISKQAYDQAETAFKQAEAAYQASKQQVERAKVVLDMVKAGQLQAQSTAAGAQGLAEQLAVAEIQYQAAVVQKETAEAVVKEIELALDKTVIKSPMDGIVVDKLVKSGELVIPGTPVARLMDTKEMTVNVFIPEVDLGKVKVNDEARIYSDSFPDQYAEGRVASIASEAQFTPKNVHVKEERERLVYKVKVRFVDEKGVFKSGMPVDVYIRWDDQAKWE